MFFHIFKNTFIVNKPVPDKIRFNFNIDNTISLNDCTTIENMMDTIYNKEINEFKYPTFVELDEILLNPIIRNFCFTMGIKYDAYKIMVDFSNFYTYFCINTYHPDYKDRYVPFSKEEFSESDSKINKWNVGNIPLEFLINHISTNEYVNKIYHMYYSYYKKLLAEQGLPHIRFHDLRSTYATILMKNNFNLKGISNLLGHAKEIISADVYGDTKEIIADCLDVLQPFIEEVLPDTKKSKHYDFSDVTIMNDIIRQLLPVA